MIFFASPLELPIKLEPEDDDSPPEDSQKSHTYSKEDTRDYQSLKDSRKKSSSSLSHIKLEPEDFEIPYSPEEVKKSSSSSSSSDRHKHKSDHHHHHSSRHEHSSKEEKKSKSNEKKSSDKHHKHHHSSTSHVSSSSKRKHEGKSMESKENEATQKKTKIEHEIKKELPSKTATNKETKTSSSSSSKTKEKSSKRKPEREKIDEEMDGSQGLGFADALALFDMPSTSKKKEAQLADKIFRVPSKASKEEKKSSPNKSGDLKKSLKVLTAPPKLLVQKPKLEPLPDIVNDLPSDISIPEYRPMQLSSAVKDYINSSVLGASSSYPSRPPQKFMTDAELLTESFSSKANRTRVYSGNRVQRSVPSLFEMCIRVLQENIGFLECTGGVPFDILRPVLERASTDQLQNIEYYNPYLLEDSDVLWEPHCKRKFRTRKRLEMESWRELYERCTREDEEKLSRLTQNIKQNQETTSNGVQKTMLAFVDSMVKPPRNVMRQQEIFGTNRKVVVSAAARTEGLKNIMPNLVLAGDARLRVSAGLRDDAQNGEFNLFMAVSTIYVNFFSYSRWPQHAAK